LYNLNSSTKISEDGIYGPATANALYNSPCGGFAKTSFNIEEADAFLF
jgi:hypothetical protein